MRNFFWLFVIIASCQQNQSSNENTGPTPSPAKTIVSEENSIAPITQPSFQFDYAIQKKRCQQLYAEHKKKRTAASEKIFISFLMDSLVACWYGTPWDYNGISETPGKGQIACGYYVTTTLRDAGMKINRVKLAQCIEQHVLWDLCTDFKKFSDKSLDHFVESVKKAGYGLYIVGLDNHTGYLYNDGEEVWFIHSGVYAPKCALKEKAIHSITLKNSRYRVFGRIIWNK